MTCLVMFMVPLRVLVKPQPTLPPAVTVKVAAPLALPPGPQLIAVWVKSGLPALSLTVYVPGTTTKAVVAVPALVLRGKLAGGPPGPSEVVKVKLPLPPMTCLVMLMVPLRVLVKPQPTLPPAVTVKVAAPLALPPGPQLIAVWVKDRLRARSLSRQVPVST